MIALVGNADTIKRLIRPRACGALTSWNTLPASALFSPDASREIAAVPLGGQPFCVPVVDFSA